jgi:hypothetical protein
LFSHAFAKTYGLLPQKENPLRIFFTTTKNFNQHPPPQCVCFDPQHKIRLPEHFHGKISVVRPELEKYPHPSSIDARLEIIQAFVLLLKNLSKLLSQAEVNAQSFSRLGSYSPSSCNLAERFLSGDQAFAKAHTLIAQTASLTAPMDLESFRSLSLTALTLFSSDWIKMLARLRFSVP